MHPWQSILFKKIHTYVYPSCIVGLIRRKQVTLANLKSSKTTFKYREAALGRRYNPIRFGAWKSQFPFMNHKNLHELFLYVIDAQIPIIL